MNSSPRTMTDSRKRPRELWELSLAVVLIAVAVFGFIGTAGMQVIGDDVPGPRLFPLLTSVVLAITGIGLSVKVLRKHFSSPATGDVLAADEATGTAMSTTGEEAESFVPTDLRTLALTILVFVVFVAALQPVGWLLSATALFYTLCLLFGTTHKVRDLLVALCFASAVQIIFSMGLGLSLPTGIIGGIAQWIS